MSISKAEVTPPANGSSLPRQRRTYLIGELARMFEVTPRTIRFYEQEGLLAPERRGQTRIYHEKDRVRLKLTLRGKRLGFSLAEIREVIEMYDAMPDGNARQLKRLLEILADKRNNMERQLEDIRLMQRELDDVEMRAREVLERLGQA
ncbi:MerR family DNA-binding transcriptional regulator [Halomonas sp. MCCC 1A17488]|uniref:MerR family DNA-binding transcriptional regulator n=1 Tax=Billgrantia sulfidoxydans TaxID=2733484 RepID=A0ABX7W5A4_9GAMM|nr:MULTISPECIES: MerR family DNA-binding transcriptional regulator [Halomonas]MCE8015332.1 MerR family DNA-binding transcriptional regulator [Halomonas sp. MCCC 1A17488]MCG3238665.1 MerR family DNA-binding transcriptional regulator [Halomonas sp. MCCC 1A17488]QPP51361.1 MerR family DNA-binding transcriptional regulator [Halomonas sp. SS10-MC5]QTP54915.1 MerR family DNA-binding transcriptional regulator [Halomonas sulfidoxydans]